MKFVSCYGVWGSRVVVPLAHAFLEKGDFMWSRSRNVNDLSPTSTTFPSWGMTLQVSWNMEISCNRAMVCFLGPSIIVEYITLSGDACRGRSAKDMVDFMFRLGTRIVCGLYWHGEVCEDVYESRFPCPVIDGSMNPRCRSRRITMGIEVTSNETGRPSGRHML